MKKLLTLMLLFVTTVSFGQSILDYSRVNTVSQVGDTLIVKFQYSKGDGNDAKLYQFDFQYNNKLLTPITKTWQTTSTSAQKAINAWNGYKFNPDATKTATDYDGQYTSWLSGGANYSTNADWSVERITYQDVTSLADGAEFIKYAFKIKDKGLTNYTDYTNLLNANWVNYKEANGTLIDVTKGSSNHQLSLSNIQGGDAGNVSISVSSNVISNNIGDGTHFGYTIYLKSDFVNGIDQNTPVIASGMFDASGDATITGLENDTEYQVMIYIDGQQTYLDEAVTISDLALVFQQAIGTDINGGGNALDYHLQKLFADIYRGQGDAFGTINFQDSYEMLAYLQGVDTQNQVFISKTGQAFNASGLKATYGNVNANGLPAFDGVIKPTDVSKSFEFAHGLAGDVNFSHSYQPTSVNATMATAKSSGVQLMSSAKYVPMNANIDLVSELKDGKVVFSINSEVQGMVGSQFNIVYDTQKLHLENVLFDTGNEMTNFANHKEQQGKINIGSFDQNFTANVKSGTPYKLIFTPKVQLQNTSGLITFKVKEGVKADGTQIKFIIN